MLSAQTVQMFTRCLVVTIAGALFLAQAQTIEAGPVVFTDRTAFNAAAQPNMFEDFSAPVQCHFVNSFCDLTYSGLTFSYDIADLPGIPIVTPQAIDFLNVGPDFAVSVKFSPLTALGFDVMPLGNEFGLKVTPRIRQLDGTEAFGDAMTLLSPGFFGFYVNDGTVLTGLGLAPNQPASTLVAIDNLAASVPVPEPATLLLFGAGASALLAGRRHRKN